jgi:hypothetical protein
MSDESPTVPPISQPDPFAAYPDEGGRRRSNWPLIFGGISLVVGVFGLCMQSLMLFSVFFNSVMMGAMGMETTPPPEVVKWAAGVQSIIMLPLGIVLIAGSAMLMLRKPLGAKLVRIWAVGRLAMVVIGLVVGIAIMRPQAQWSVTLTAEMRDELRKKGMKEEQLPPLLDEEKAMSDGIRNVAIFSIAFAIWPFAMAWVLSRPNSKADIESWRLPQA